MPRLGLSLSTAIIALAVAAPVPAHAGGGFHGGHRHVFFHSGVFFGFGGFPGAYYGYPYYSYAYAPYPYPYPYPYPPPSAYDGAYPPPPAGSVPPPPPGAPQPMAPPPPATSVPPAAQQVWYYCPPTKSLYPHVTSCAVAWQAIPTTPPAASHAPAPLVAQAARPPQAPQQQPQTHGSETALQAFLRELREDEQQQQPRVIAHFKNAAGQECEAFEQPITIDGKSQRASGTVCQRADGRWVIAPGPPPIHASRPQPQG
jgi:hypothetical protein